MVSGRSTALRTNSGCRTLFPTPQPSTPHHCRWTPFLSYAHATRRFWRALNGRPAGPDFRTLPAQLRQWRVLSLRGLDARLRGESYRAIAEVLLGFQETKEDFEVDPRKNKARRLERRMARVLSAIRCSRIQRSPNSPKLFASLMRRLSRCFSWAGDRSS